MIKIDIDTNKISSIEIKGNQEDLAIEFSIIFENLIRNGVPVAMLVGAMIQACCQGELSVEEFKQIANTVTDMLEALADKYFDKRGIDHE